MTSSPRAGDGETTLSENVMTNPETVSGDRTPPSEAELIDALENVQTTGGPKAGFRRLEVLEWLHDTLPALLADRTDAERWRYIRTTMVVERWERAASLTVHCWKVPPVSNPDATVEEIVDAARAPGASGSGT